MANDFQRNVTLPVMCESKNDSIEDARFVQRTLSTETVDKCLWPIDNDLPGDDRVIGITANARNNTSNNLWSR